ncbi:hypothetical protein MNBD_NITROSPINAE04-631 [hydrothermal vent metagenome]|uniref:GAF domain-containing protein n=1 Tax=hydrothermal vent metagenome TaxID=652676 RepID=A0A3B1D956_9ZZZZ
MDIQEKESRIAFLENLRQITYMIHSAENMDDIFLYLQDPILSLLDAERITIYAFDDINNELFSKYIAGDFPMEIRVPVNKSSIAGYSAYMKCSVSISDAYNGVELLAINHDLRFDKSWDKLTGFITRQALAHPIMHNDHLFGVIQIINKKNGASFTVYDQEAVKEIAEVLGLAMFNQKKSHRGFVEGLRRQVSKIKRLLKN